MKLQFKRFFSVDSPKAIKAKKYPLPQRHQLHGPAQVGRHRQSLPACLSRLHRALPWPRMRTGVYGVGRDQLDQFCTRFAANVRRATSCNSGKNIWWKCCTISRPRAEPQSASASSSAVRPNGATDIAYEGLRVMIMPSLAAELSKISGHEVTAGAHTIFSAFPNVQFVDYTKNPRRFERELPAKLQPDVFPIRDK